MFLVLHHELTLSNDKLFLECLQSVLNNNKR